MIRDTMKIYIEACFADGENISDESDGLHANTAA